MNKTKKLYYAVDKTLSKISEGFLNFDVDPNTRQVIGIEDHPKLAEVLLISGVITATKPRTKNRKNVEVTKKGVTIRKRARIKT